jgi:hypothetical protein
MIHAVSQSLEAEVWLSLATDAKAHVSKVTATTSGNLLQSTNSAPERDGCLERESATEIIL